MRGAAFSAAQDFMEIAQEAISITPLHYATCRHVIAIAVICAELLLMPLLSMLYCCYDEYPMITVVTL